LDRCFSEQRCTRPAGKLIAVACLFIASKLRDTGPIGLVSAMQPRARLPCFHLSHRVANARLLPQNELVKLTNNTYQKTQIVQAEAQVFTLLGFHLLSATAPVELMEHLLALARLERPLSDVLLKRARMLLNASLTDYDLMSYNAPCLALSAVLSAYTAHGVSCRDFLARIAGVPLGVDPQSHGVDVCRAAQHAAVDRMAAAGTTLETNSRVGVPLEPSSPSPTALAELQLEGGRAGQQVAAKVEAAPAAQRMTTPHTSPGGRRRRRGGAAAALAAAAVPVPIGSKRAGVGAGPPLKRPRGRPATRARTRARTRGQVLVDLVAPPCGSPRPANPVGGCLAAGC
jgi:hypothetical protein